MHHIVGGHVLMGTDSPMSINFAQAALQMQSVSGGRFEAGLGARWSRDEAVGAGIGYPSAGVRAGRYIEAIQIVRALLATGACSFVGQHHQVNVPPIGPRPSCGPPPLVASLGGERTIRSIARWWTEWNSS